MQSGLEVNGERMQEGKSEKREKRKYSMLEVHEPGESERGKENLGAKGRGKRWKISRESTGTGQAVTEP